MAEKIKAKQILRLEYDNGKSESGKQKYKAQSFSEINPSATDAGMLAVSLAVDKLTKKTVLKTQEVITNEIYE